MRYMPYTTNPHMPQVRMNAVKMVRKGHSMRSVARHFGYNVSTISKWVKRAPDDGRRTIPTQSSRPHTQPHALPQAVIDLGEKFGRIMNYGDGVYGGQFVGAMYAEAFLKPTSIR